MSTFTLVDGFNFHIGQFFSERGFFFGPDPFLLTVGSLNGFPGRGSSNTNSSNSGSFFQQNWRVETVNFDLRYYSIRMDGQDLLFGNGGNAAPTGGTVTSITYAYLAADSDGEFTIDFGLGIAASELHSPAGLLIDLDDIWHKAFIGDDTFYSSWPGHNEEFGLTGDFFNLDQSLFLELNTLGIVTAGHDQFLSKPLAITITIGSDPAIIGTLYGDAITYGGNGIFIAGDDLFDFGSRNTLTIYGDIGSISSEANFGTVFLGDDTIFGQLQADTLVGDVGTISGMLDIRLGDDEIHGGDGNDLIYGDYQYEPPSTRGITGGNDNLFGDDGDDTIYGGPGFDRIEGGDGNDKLFGGDGVDILTGGAGFDELDGGEGPDIADYLSSPAGVLVNLTTGLGFNASPQGGHANGDTYVDIESAAGSNFDDVLIGSDGANALIGYDGSDNLTGLANNDLLEGGDGDDFLEGGEGNDDIDGGRDIDTAIYRGFSTDFEIIHNSDGTKTVRDLVTNDGLDEGEDALSNVDRLFFAADNTFIDLSTFGTGASESLFGTASADTIFGGAGDDNIDGGAGFDKLFGGAGNDRITYDASDDLANILGGADIDTLVIIGGVAPIDFDLGAHQFELAEHSFGITGGAQRDTYNASWQWTDRTIYQDDGSRSETIFDPTNATDTVQIDNNFDAGGAYVSQTAFYDAGGRWAAQFNIPGANDYIYNYFDAADQLDYTNGRFDTGLTFLEDTDQGNQFDWTNKYAVNTASNQADYQYDYYDNGTRSYLDHDQDGVEIYLYQYTFYDVNDDPDYYYGKYNNGDDYYFDL